jgi:hypothetical protein
MVDLVAPAPLLLLPCRRCAAAHAAVQLLRHSFGGGGVGVRRAHQQGHRPGLLQQVGQQEAQGARHARGRGWWFGLAGLHAKSVRGGDHWGEGGGLPLRLRALPLPPPSD